MARKDRFLVALGVVCTLSDVICGTISAASTMYAHLPASASNDRSDCIHSKVSS